MLFLSSLVLMGCNNEQDNGENIAPDVEKRTIKIITATTKILTDVDEDDTINKDDEQDNDIDPEDTDKDKKDEKRNCTNL
ncbi:hypothetical protein [Bacillus spizizenii]|uniref:hypothetical protein n=1 Tax=Bacillus spizizenii TaxID=96241 RepID=UPI000318E3B0|nr:hypothetical protein [Bacillus spizizenii]